MQVLGIVDGSLQKKVPSKVLPNAISAKQDTILIPIRTTEIMPSLTQVRRQAWDFVETDPNIGRIWSAAVAGSKSLSYGFKGYVLDEFPILLATELLTKVDLQRRDLGHNHWRFARPTESVIRECCQHSRVIWLGFQLSANADLPGYGNFQRFVQKKPTFCRPTQTTHVHSCERSSSTLDVLTT
jgi:hypothetical protein